MNVSIGLLKYVVNFLPSLGEIYAGALVFCFEIKYLVVCFSYI